MMLMEFDKEIKTLQNDIIPQLKKKKDKKAVKDTEKGRLKMHGERVQQYESNWEKKIEFMIKNNNLYNNNVFIEDLEKVKHTYERCYFEVKTKHN